nr:hypothetical protein [Tanacetum cinerariifolium]
TACLPDDTIFEEMARMSTMASAIICLANNQKFNFSKYILDNMVLDLEKAKTAQAKEIANLKKIVKKLERKKKSRTSGLKRMDKGRIDEIDANGDLIDKTTQDQRRMNEEDLFRVNDLDGDEVIVDVIVDVEVTTAAVTPQISKDDLAEHADKQLAEQLQAQEREQLSIEERSRLLAELIESRRKYFAAKKAEEIRNKPLKEL